jgi:predicted ATPase
LPPTLSETILARTRRLAANALDGLRLAAVLGRELTFDLLNAAWGQGEEVTLEALDALLRQRLVEETVAAGDSDFAFTHHKIQEVVYQALPRPRRLHLHAQVGRAMEALFAAEREARAGELAYHFQRACRVDRSLCDKAVGYLLQAGQQAVRQSANQEAMAYYRRGLDILHAQPETGKRVQREIDLQLALASATAVVHGYAAPETRRAYDRARDLCRGLGRTPALATVLVGLGRYYGVSGDPETGLEIAAQVLSIARKVEDNVLLVEGHRLMGGLLFSRGRLREAVESCQQGVTLYELAQHERHAYRFGHDPAATCLSFLGIIWWLLGCPDQARAQRQKLCNLMLSMTHPPSLAYAHCFLAMQAWMAHDVPATRGHAGAAIELGQRHGTPSWTAMATILRGWALVEQGQFAAGLAQLQAGTAAWQAIGFAHFTPIFLGMQAETYLQMDRPGEAATAVAAAWAIVRKGMDRFWLAELHRLEGELVRAEGRNGQEAEAQFRQAIDAARGQEARMLELRAATALARLWRDQGRTQDARQLLAEVSGRFDKGLDAYDLQAAAAVLETLA